MLRSLVNLQIPTIQTSNQKIFQAILTQQSLVKDVLGANPSDIVQNDATSIVLFICVLFRVTMCKSRYEFSVSSLP